MTFLVLPTSLVGLEIYLVNELFNSRVITGNLLFFFYAFLVLFQRVYFDTGIVQE